MIGRSSTIGARGSLVDLETARHTQRPLCSLDYDAGARTESMRLAGTSVSFSIDLRARSQLIDVTQKGLVKGDGFINRPVEECHGGRGLGTLRRCKGELDHTHRS